MIILLLLVITNQSLVASHAKPDQRCHINVIFNSTFLLNLELTQLYIYSLDVRSAEFSTADHTSS